MFYRTSAIKPNSSHLQLTIWIFLHHLFISSMTFILIKKFYFLIVPLTNLMFVFFIVNFCYIFFYQYFYYRNKSYSSLVYLSRAVVIVIHVFNYFNRFWTPEIFSKAYDSSIIYIPTSCLMPLSYTILCYSLSVSLSAIHQPSTWF